MTNERYFINCATTSTQTWHLSCSYTSIEKMTFSRVAFHLCTTEEETVMRSKCRLKWGAEPAQEEAQEVQAAANDRQSASGELLLCLVVVAKCLTATPLKKARNSHDAAMFPRRQPQSDGGSPAHCPGLWEETKAIHRRLSDQGYCVDHRVMLLLLLNFYWQELNKHHEKNTFKTF